MADVQSPDQPRAALRASEASHTPDFATQVKALEDELERRITRARQRGEPGPRVVNRYQVDKIVARGGFGIVVDAQDLQLARRVALKFVPIVGSDRRELDRLAREGRALARIDHPGVVRVFDSGATEIEVEQQTLSCSFVAMELLRGDTLAQWSTDRPRGIAQILPLLVSAGYGLMAVHEVGMVHRDVKPQNVIVSKGRVVWVDFGLARLASEWGDRFPPSGADPVLGGVTTVGTVVGTPDYMPPEIRLGQPCTFASDQWSFAATCWEVLSGKRPELSGSAVKLPRWWRVPRALRVVLRRGLETRPDDRHPAVGDLVEALSSWGQVHFKAVQWGKWLTPLAVLVAVITTPIWEELGHAVLEGVAGIVKSFFTSLFGSV